MEAEKNLQQDDFEFSKIGGKKVIGRFDGNEISSDGGLLLLRELEGRIKLLEHLGEAIHDKRHRSYIEHELIELLRERTFLIACGYEDGNDFDRFREDSLLKLSIGRDPLDGHDLASQPTVSRLENSISLKDLIRMGRVFVDTFIESYDEAPQAIVLDMDPTSSIVYGDQQLRLFNAHEDEYCLMPFHVYEGQSGKLIATIIRPGKTPTAKEIISITKRIVARIRAVWPEVRIIFRGDSHHTKPAVMDWFEANRIDFITGLSPNSRLTKEFHLCINDAEKAYNRYCKEAAQTWQEEGKVLIGRPIIRFSSGYYQAKSWSNSQRVVCRVIVSSQGTDVRYVVTSFRAAGAKYLYQSVYCGRGAMELMIKEHKNALMSDRLSCSSAIANQFRLFVHGAAYVLLHQFRAQYLAGTKWAKSQMDTIRLRLLKVAAVVENKKTRVIIHLPKTSQWSDLMKNGTSHFSELFSST